MSDFIVNCINAESRVAVGRTKLKVSRLGLGTAPLGGLYKTLDEEEAVAVVAQALSSGLNLIDTAPLYGQGQSEKLVGKALQSFDRNSFVVSTKVGRLISPEGKVTFDFSRDGILRSFEASLERLKLQQIDILLLHDPDNHYQQVMSEAYPTLLELREQGLVSAIGAGMNQWEMLLEFVRHADFDCFLLAGRYTLLEQKAAALLDLCHSRNISVFLGGIFNSGILATGAIAGAKYDYQDAPVEILERVKAIERICRSHNVELRKAALQFGFTHPGVTSLVVGAESPEEIADNQQALGQPVPVALWQDLHSAGLI